MANELLLGRLEKLLAQLEKEAAQQKEKSWQVMIGGPDKPIMEWTPAERATFLRTSPAARIGRSDKLLDRAFELEHAAEDLRNMIFLQKMQMRHGRR